MPQDHWTRGMLRPELEKWILGLNILGWGNEDMAEYLGFSEFYIRQMFHQLHIKFGTSSKLELAMMFLHEKGDMPGCCKAFCGSVFCPTFTQVSGDLKTSHGFRCPTTKQKEQYDFVHN